MRIGDDGTQVAVPAEGTDDAGQALVRIRLFVAVVDCVLDDAAAHCQAALISMCTREAACR